MSSQEPAYPQLPRVTVYIELAADRLFEAMLLLDDPACWNHAAHADFVTLNVILKIIDNMAEPEVFDQIAEKRERRRRQHREQARGS